VHHVLITAQDTDTTALLRLSGAAEFGFVSCRKAQWNVDLSRSMILREMAATTNPGALSGSGVIVTALTEPLEVGAEYLLSYQVLASGGSLFTPANNGSPFGFRDLPASVGNHEVLLTALDSDTAAAMRINGALTFGSVSIRRTGSTAGQPVEWRVDYGTLSTQGTVSTPDIAATQEPAQGREIFVAATGSDTAGSGTLEAPFREPGQAAAIATPGDTIYLRPGTYAPFEITASGTPDNPIRITTLPDEAHQAVIRGDFDQHVVHGGPGVARDNTIQDGVVVLGASHVEIRNLAVEWVSRNGIMIEGQSGVSMTGITVAGCRTRNTGSSGVSCIGLESGNDVLPIGEPTRIRDVVIELNDISTTNLPSDYRQGRQGVVEAISVGKAVANVVTRWNHIHDTLQYGIDYKHGVDGGAIYENVMVDVEKHGIYLDTNRRYLNDIRIYNNICVRCGSGVALAREADFDGTLSPGSGTFETPEPGSPLALEIADMQQTLARIDVYNNIFAEIEGTGILLYRHFNSTDPAGLPWQSDSPHGSIEDVRVRFNTIYNCALRGSGNEIRAVGWTDQAFLDAGIASGVEIVGNLAYRSPENPATTKVFENRFAGLAGFSVAANVTDADPLFTAPDTTATVAFDGTSRPVVSGPDFTLQEGSPAIGVVAGYGATPFNIDASGDARPDPADAGAY
jgi:hypothetical protein